MNQTTRHLISDRNLVRRAYDDAADSYEASAVLEAEVLQRHLERLELVRIEPGFILDAGCGNGRAIGPLRTRFPEARVLATDFSFGMLGHLQGEAAPLCADICELPLANDSVDMIFSNLALQWVSDLELAISEFRRVLKPEGLFSFTSYGPDTLIELRSAWATVDNETHVSQFIDMHDVGDALVRNGLAEPVMDVEQFTLSYADVDGLMSDLKRSGAHNLTDGRPRGLTGKDKLKSMVAAYEHFRDNGRLPASYEVVYGHAWAPSIKTSRQDGEFHFPASSIGRRDRGTET